MCPLYGTAKDLKAVSFSNPCLGIKSFTALGDDNFLACVHQVQLE